MFVYFQFHYIAKNFCFILFLSEKQCIDFMLLFSNYIKINLIIHESGDIKYVFKKIYIKKTQFYTIFSFNTLHIINFFNKILYSGGFIFHLNFSSSYLNNSHDRNGY